MGSCTVLCTLVRLYHFATFQELVKLGYNLAAALNCSFFLPNGPSMYSKHTQPTQSLSHSPNRPHTHYSSVQ